MGGGKFCRLHDSLIHIEHGGCFYGAFFHADLFTASGLRIIVPFRGGIGVRHSFFTSAQAYAQLT